MDIQLKVGGVYATHDGVEDKIEGMDHGCSDEYVFRANRGSKCYAKDGRRFPGNRPNDDLVRVISEPCNCEIRELTAAVAKLGQENAELRIRLEKLEGAKAPEIEPGTMIWVRNNDGQGWCRVKFNRFADDHERHSSGCVVLAGGARWKQYSLTDPRPFEAGDPVMVRDTGNDEWSRSYFIGKSGSRYMASCLGPWTREEANPGFSWDECRHPTPEELAERGL